MAEINQNYIVLLLVSFFQQFFSMFLFAPLLVWLFGCLLCSMLPDAGSAFLVSLLGNEFLKLFYVLGNSMR